MERGPSITVRCECSSSAGAEVSLLRPGPSRRPSFPLPFFPLLLSSHCLFSDKLGPEIGKGAYGRVELGIDVQTGEKYVRIESCP